MPANPRNEGGAARPPGRLTVKAFAKLLYQAFSNHGVDDSAASLGYYFVFSLFPFLFFLATLTAYLPFVQQSVARMLGSARRSCRPRPCRSSTST